MEKNGLKVSRAKTEHLQTTGDTDPVRMKRYMEIEMINLPTVQYFKYIGSTIDRGGVASKDMKKKKKKNDLFPTTTTFSHKLYKFELYIQLEKEVNKRC